MSETFKEPKCECGHYQWTHIMPASKPMKLWRCMTITGCTCLKFTSVLNEEKESA